MLTCPPHTHTFFSSPPGAKKREEIYEAFENIYPVLQDFRKGDANIPAGLPLPVPAATPALAATPVAQQLMPPPPAPQQMQQMQQQQQQEEPTGFIPPPSPARQLPPPSPAHHLPPPTPMHNQLPPPSPYIGSDAAKRVPRMF